MKQLSQLHGMAWLSGLLFVFFFGHSWLSDQVRFYFIHFSYFIIAGLVATAAVKAFLYWKQNSDLANLRKHWPGVAVAISLTAIAFLSHPGEFRVFSDEANLMSVSRTLFAERKALNTVMAEQYFGNLNPVLQVIPKRPLLFPFLVQVVHSLVGFSPSNVFWLNAIVLFCLLFTVYLVGKHFSDSLTGISAVLFLCCYPVIALTATSGSFDLFATLIYVWVLIFVYRYTQFPRAETFGVLWLLLVLLANIRYESFLYFFLVLGLLVLSKSLRLSHVKANLSLVTATPLFSLPLFWQKILLIGKYEHPEGTSLFSFGQFVDNFHLFLKGQLDYGVLLPYASPITAAAVIVSLIVVWNVFQKKVYWDKALWKFLFISSFVVGTTYVIFFSLFIGKYDNPTAARYFLILGCICSLLLASSSRVIQSVPRWGVFGLSLGLYLFFQPVGLENRFFNSLIVTREAHRSYEILKEIDSHNVLIIADRPVVFTAKGFGAVDMAYANQYVERILTNFDRHLYSQLLVFQRAQYSTQYLIPEHELHPSFRLRPIREIQLTESEYLKVSLVEKGSSKPSKLNAK